ncbi:hypothetical protein ElyMa_001062100 [Elysia marginata]|uniref:Uncharacterized protein n=1 Tax=Elysia marginata TaxID=1093978 RepID=A0AAV4HRE3_9GAST|nr:hypothetical protein ElyMa_001062100 [Elysia marginata]
MIPSGIDTKPCDAETTPDSTGRRQAPRPPQPPSGTVPAPRPGSPVRLVPQDWTYRKLTPAGQQQQDFTVASAAAGLEMAVRMNSSEAGGFKLLEEDALDDRPCAAVKKFVSSVLERKDMKDADVASSFRNVSSTVHTF